jgi:hypothetical protein
VTLEQAIRVVEKVLLENRENGELEGILNRHRVAALNRLIRYMKLGIFPRTNTKRSSLSKATLQRP